MFKRKTVAAFLALPALFFLAGCGGGGSLVAGGGTGGTGISTGVITGFGSVIVNDVEFDVFGTVITVNDNTAAENNLRLGMVAKIRGTFNPDGLTGVADLLDAENEVLGPISGFGPEVDSFTVLGQKIFVNGNTVFDTNIFPPDLSGLVQGDIVEVYGLKEISGIRGTRVEKKTPGQGGINVKGLVSNYTGQNTFNIGALLVTFTPQPPAGFDNGVFVEVEGDPTGPVSMTATNIELEDLEDAEFEPGGGEDGEVEGFVSGYTSLSSFFFVNGRLVDASGARFEEGVPGDLADDVRVEAEGVWTMIGVDLVLVAEKIEFE
ncbi:MAG: DUF5666 domain-containing protein [Candidatus Deferrimicrobiaceae bacterium]